MKPTTHPADDPRSVVCDVGIAKSNSHKVKSGTLDVAPHQASYLQLIVTLLPPYSSTNM